MRICGSYRPFIGTCALNGGACCDHCFPAVAPPSTTIDCPVTNVDSSLASGAARYFALITPQAMRLPASPVASVVASGSGS